jgi:hypothetical protein
MGVEDHKRPTLLPKVEFLTAYYLLGYQFPTGLNIWDSRQANRKGSITSQICSNIQETPCNLPCSVRPEAGETLEKKRDLGHDHKYST